MRFKWIFLLLAIALLVNACAPQAAPAPEPRALTVLAAASLKDAFGEIARLFESQHPGVTVSISFGGSQQLAEQLNQGAPADVFASASTKYMNAAVASGRVAEGTSAIFARNRLIVIFQVDRRVWLVVVYYSVMG